MSFDEKSWLKKCQATTIHAPILLDFLKGEFQSKMNIGSYKRYNYLLLFGKIFMLI